MRNLLIIATLAFSLFSNAQKMSKEFLEGEWTSNGEATEIIFSIVNKKDLSIEEVSSTSGIPLKVISYELTKKNIYIRSLFEPNDWESITKFIILDENTMAAYIASDAPGYVLYERKSNKQTTN
jgi:predicted HTH domain antitoxin